MSKREEWKNIAGRYVLDQITMALAHSMTVVDQLNNMKGAIIQGVSPEFKDVAKCNLRAEMARRSIESLVIFFSEGDTDFSQMGLFDDDEDADAVEDDEEDDDGDEEGE